MNLTCTGPYHPGALALAGGERHPKNMREYSGKGMRRAGSDSAEVEGDGRQLKASLTR